MTSGPIDAQPPDRPTALLRAAEEVFCERGFAGGSAGAIAKRAGVNKALIFYHFGTKEGLFDQVVQRYYAAHRQALQGAFERPGELGERMHRLMDAYFDFMADNSRYARLVQHEVAAGDHGRLGAIRKGLQSMLGWLEAALADQLTGAEDPARSPRQLFVSFSGLVINYFTYAPALSEAWGDDPLGPDALAERRAHLHWVLGALLSDLTE